VNDITRLQALIDKKKVVVTKVTIREALRLDDEEGVEYLPNEETFCRVGYNGLREAIHQAYVLQSILLKLVNVFANMRRVGKWFYGVETPLFEGMLVDQQVVKEGDADKNDETINAGDAAKGDVSAAHGEVLTVAKEPSILSLTPSTPPPQPSHDIPYTS
nr:hypothetical protein [Tanacetum cinerariifolium]